MLGVKDVQFYLIYLFKKENHSHPPQEAVCPRDELALTCCVVSRRYIKKKIYFERFAVLCTYFIFCGSIAHIGSRSPCCWGFYIAHRHTDTHTNTHTDTHTDTHTHIYICVCVCVCLCIHICIYGTLQIDLLLVQVMHNWIYCFLLQVSSEFILQRVGNGGHLKVSWYNASIFTLINLFFGVLIQLHLTTCVIV